MFHWICLGCTPQLPIQSSHLSYLLKLWLHIYSTLKIESFHSSKMNLTQFRIDCFHTRDIWIETKLISELRLQKSEIMFWNLKGNLLNTAVAHERDQKVELVHQHLVVLIPLILYDRFQATAEVRTITFDLTLWIDPTQRGINHIFLNYAGLARTRSGPLLMAVRSREQVGHEWRNRTRTFLAPGEDQLSSSRLHGTVHLKPNTTHTPN